MRDHGCMVDEANLDEEDLAIYWEFLEGWHFGEHGHSLQSEPDLDPEQRARMEAQIAEMDAAAAAHVQRFGLTAPRTAEEIYGGPLPSHAAYRRDAEELAAAQASPFE